MINELDIVALTRPLPEFGLVAGDIGTVVMIHEAGKGYSVEFMTLNGTTVAVTTLPADDVRPIRERDIANARQVA